MSKLMNQGKQRASYQMTGIGVGVIILARVCSTANLLNSSTVAPPLRLSNTTTIPVQIKESNRSVMHPPILLLLKTRSKR